VVARRDGVILTNSIGVIDQKPPPERVMVSEWQSVEQRYPGFAFDSSRASALSFSDGIKSSRCDAHRRERADEHDVISHEQPDR